MLNILCKIILLTLLCFLIFCCEPISVSVNSQGEVAFSRSEGVFFINFKSGKLSEVDWNFGKDTIPIIVRWSPKDDFLAYSVRENKDSQNTSIFSISRKSDNKKMLYTTPGKPVTQLEWSKKNSYISLAQAGEDTDINVADLVLISVKDGMSKVISKNCGDVHKWLDDNTIVFIKINQKNPNNADILKGELCLYKVDTQEISVLTKLIAGKVGGLDVEPGGGQIVFTALRADKDAGDFIENMTLDSYLFSYNFKNNAISKLSDRIINFVQYSPDGNRILIKFKDENRQSLINLGYMDAKSLNIKILVGNINDTVNINSMNAQIYPAWFDNNSVLYFRMNNNYGSNGQAIHLMGTDINTLKMFDYQLVIDTEVAKIVEKKGGYW